MGQSTVLMGRYEPKRSKYCLNLIKKSLKIIVGILARHSRLNYHLAKLRIYEDAAYSLINVLGQRTGVKIPVGWRHNQHIIVCKYTIIGKIVAFIIYIAQQKFTFILKSTSFELSNFFFF